MAHVRASISFHVDYDSDLHEVPTAQDLLDAYLALEDYVNADDVLTAGHFSISFDIGDEGGGAE